jgi:formylglycine-generating enzyme required for sulfatase activity
LKHQSKINEKRTMLAGFSLGGDVSFALTLRNPDRFAGALIMSSGMNYRSPRYFERLRGKQTRLYLTMGSVDGRLNGMQKSKNMLDQYGIKTEMKVIAGQGHEPPPRDEFVKGMQFLLSAPDAEAQRQADQERLRQEREKLRGGGALPGPQVAQRDSPQPPEAPKTLRNSIGMEVVLIQAGTFQMVSNNGHYDQKPVHTVRISRPFYLGKYEVTQAQWQAVMGNNPSKFKRDDAIRPVEMVSWDNVQEFIRRLNANEGVARYQLPTEAEWEYAARAGTTTFWSFGDDASQLGRYGWCDNKTEEELRQMHPVGQLRPNPWGLYDMHGNVAEWVQDWYGDYASGTAVDPTGPASGLYHVLRDGCESYSHRLCGAGCRHGGPPGAGALCL